MRRIIFLFAAVLFFTAMTVAAGAGEGRLRVKVAPMPPDLSASVQFTEPSGNSILDAGEADANRDGAITVGELDHYLREHVPYMARRLTGNEQTPVVTGNAADVVAVLKR